jgi:hypothetical protein
MNVDGCKKFFLWLKNTNYNIYQWQIIRVHPHQFKKQFTFLNQCSGAGVGSAMQSGPASAPTFVFITYSMKQIL